MGILAGGKYAAEVVYSMIRREMVMQSPVYQEWAKEERIEGRIEGRIEKAREDICKFMVRRFGADPDEITQKIGQISSLEILDKLMEELFAANTKEEAQNIIGNGTARLS
jgi:predicted transposase YdaD